MHEATTINSFRHFLDNRETFNRGEDRRRWYRGIVRPSYRSTDSTLISRGFYTTAATWKNASLSNEQTLSPSGERRGGGLPRTDTTLPMEISLAFSLHQSPPPLERMWVNLSMNFPSRRSKADPF